MAEIADVRAATDEVGRSKVVRPFQFLQILPISNFMFRMKLKMNVYFVAMDILAFGQPIAMG